MLAEVLVKDACTYLDPAPEFFLASLDWFNHYAERQTVWPVCLMENVMPAHPSLTLQGVTESVYDISLFFLWCYPPGDSEDLEHDPQIGSPRHTAVSGLRAMAENFLQILARDTRVFKPSDDIIGADIRSIYHFMDLNLDGAHLTFSLRLRTPAPCFPKHDGPKV